MIPQNRKEIITRARDQRDDFPELDRRQRYYLSSAGLDGVEVWARPAAAHPLLETAA